MKHPSPSAPSGAQSGAQSGTATWPASPCTHPAAGPAAGRAAGTGLLRSVAAAVLLGALASCSRPSADGGAQANGDPDAGPIAGALEKPRATKVQVAPLVRTEMVRAISAIVNAVSEREIDVFPRTAGIVTEILHEEGDRVEQGAPLMVLDRRELEAALDEARIAERESRDAVAGLTLAIDEAEARLRRAELTAEQAQRELERKEAVENVLSRNELDQLRLAAETAAADVAAERVAVERARAAVTSQEIVIARTENQVARAELNLSFATVTAPWGGVIARRDVRAGDLVSNTTVAFRLSDTDNVRAVVSRPQREFAFFLSAERGASERGLDITLEPDALPGTAYDGRILFVSPTVDPASGQFRVTLGVEQPGPGDPRPPLLPGMQVRVRIVTERHPDALVVPKRALVREGDSDFIFVVEDERARRVRVEEGFSDDDFVEVAPTADQELVEGAKVVVVGNRDLDDGALVEVAPWAGKPPGGVEPAPAAPTAEETAAGASDGAATQADPAPMPDATAPQGATDGQASSAKDEASSDDGDA